MNISGTNKLQEKILKMVELQGMGITIEDLAYALGVEIVAMRKHLTELESKDKIFISDNQVRLKSRRGLMAFFM